MSKPRDYRELGCAECRNGDALGFDISMAFQPIVDMTSKTVLAHEALVRGTNNQPAGVIFEQVNQGNLYRFDQTCRVKAIELASRLNVQGLLNINFMPNAVYRPELCIRTTLAAAEEFQFPVNRIVFEFTETEQVTDYDHLKSIITYYQQQGFLTAIDDFGAGYSGLNLLSELHTDFVKLDMALIRDIHQDSKRKTIVKHMVNMCSELGIRVIAEGIETHEEYLLLEELGITLYQGYYFARPEFEGIARVHYPNK